MPKRILKIIYNLIWAVLILFFLLVGATFLPIPGNYKVFTVQSGSMEPKIKLGSLIFVKPGTDYKVGDIVTFKIQGGKTTITHRIMKKNFQGEAVSYATKGDANEDSDPDEVKKENIIGKTFLTLPWLGFPVGYAKTKIGFILLILIPSVIIIYEELRKIKKEVVRVIFGKKTEKEPIIEKIVFEEGYAHPPEREKFEAKNIQQLRQIEIENQLKKRRKLDL